MGFNYLIYAICTIVFPLIIFNIIGNNSEIVGNINFSLIISAICNYILPFPILLFLMKKLEHEKLEKDSLNITTFLLYFCISFTLMIIGNMIGLAVTALIGTAIQSDIANPIQNLINSSDIMLNLIIISIIGPIFEELIFRKLLVDRTIKYGAKISIILSATLFGLMHGNLNQFFYAFLIGGFFAYVYIKTGSIKYSIILHIITNIMGSIVSIFIVSSADAITHGSFTAFDLVGVAIYLIIVLGSLFIGIYSLTTYNTARFNGRKTKIVLKNPIKTILLNPGMILFMLFYIFEILYQIL